MKPRTAAVGLLLVLLLEVPGARGDDREKAPPGPEVLRTLDSRGFAVDGASRATLNGTYRWPGKDPVYVSSDAGIALYLLLFRRALGDLGFAEDEALAKDVIAWDAAVRAASPGEGGRPERFFTAVLAALAGAKGPPPDEDVRGGVDAEVSRLLGDAPPARQAEVLGTPLDEARLRALIRDASSPEQARHDAAVFWLTRVRLPPPPAGNSSRQVLLRTIPDGLRERVSRRFRWAGASRLRFPGKEGVFDLEVPGDRRFPPGTLPGRAEAVGLDFGARLGSPFARERLAKADVRGLGEAVDLSPDPGTPAADFENLLALTLRRPDPRAPDLFRSPEWDALSLQSALAADALFRRILGPLQEPPRVFGAKGPECFVHPDPLFWRSLASLARRLADSVVLAGSGPALPTKEAVMASLDALDRCLAAWTPLAESDRRTLRRCRLNGWDFQSLLAVGTDGVEEGKRKDWAGWVKDRVIAPVRKAARSGALWKPLVRDEDLPAYSRSTVGMLERLADLASRLADIAVAQLDGDSPRPLARVAMDFGFLCEDAEGFQTEENQHAGCVVVLEDGTHRLVHGSDGLHDLWVLYPWKDGKVRARGVAFGYREWVGGEWPGDAAWKDLIGRGKPAVPTWAAPALEPGPAPVK